MCARRGSTDHIHFISFSSIGFEGRPVRIGARADAQLINFSYITSSSFSLEGRSLHRSVHRGSTDHVHLIFFSSKPI